MEAIQNYLVSVIRTVVPFLVGTIAAWLATKHITLDADSTRFLTLFIEGIAGVTYYLLVRSLEHVNARFGWLLGYAKMPTYVVSPTPGQLPPTDPVSATYVPTMSTPAGTGVQLK